MTKRESNQQRSLEAFMARNAEFDAVLADLQQASVEHFGADPDAVLWDEAAWLADGPIPFRSCWRTASPSGPRTCRVRMT